MRFYSGFCLKNDITFFSNYLKESAYTISGFSYGAIKAFESVVEKLDRGERVDTLQLFSPAFFQTKSVKFKKLQLLGFKRDSKSYLNLFINSCFSPYLAQTIEYHQNNYEDLEELLNYEWSLSALTKLENQGVRIEVYLGSNDEVIDVEGANNFFLDISTVTYIKNANHFLQTN